MDNMRWPRRSRRLAVVVCGLAVLGIGVIIALPMTAAI